jgi:transposase
MSTSSRSSGIPATDSSERPKRRTFTAEYKARIVGEYDAAPEGQKAGLLRREGLYSSHVTEWRRALDNGSLASSTARRQDKTRVKSAADAAELARLRRENARLRTELDKTREALVITGKVHAILESGSRIAD